MLICFCLWDAAPTQSNINKAVINGSTSGNAALGADLLKFLDIQALILHYFIDKAQNVYPVVK